MIACQNCHLDIVNVLLQSNKIQINQATKKGATPLYIACQGGHLDVVNVLLQSNKIEINQARDDGATPLYIACQNGHLNVVNVLLQSNKIQINQARDNGATPLFIACQNGHLDIVKSLIHEINKKTIWFSSTTLHQMNQPCWNNTTPMQIACQENHFDIVKYSIEQGLPSCGIANDSNEMELSWFQKLNNTNKNELLTLANHNRDEYNSSYYSFLMILIKVDGLNKNAERQNDEDAASIVSKIPIGYFCSHHPKHPIRLIGDYLCGPKSARLLWYHIILASIFHEIIKLKI